MRLVEDVRVLLPTHRPQPCFELTAWTNNNGGFDAHGFRLTLLFDYFMLRMVTVIVCQRV